ncbi:Beta-ketoacyl synthase [Venturia nashicola]|uniref:Beta-ketoacyl synthase n=1 Tax=Venturia nashicola TaxID=86259 RepID=A0A4Z1NTE6_9PEZI|nr:Beta-ketoacyl synthase [Venturia nashicola]TLD20049.1 Beta-ketoacyl synthase [Venturia nashicola]
MLGRSLSSLLIFFAICSILVHRAQTPQWNLPPKREMATILIAKLLLLNATHPSPLPFVAWHAALRGVSKHHGKFLQRGEDALCKVPESKSDTEAFYVSSGKLEVVWECLEDGGEIVWRGKNYRVLGYGDIAMAGEGVRQTTKINVGIRMRQVSVSTTLLLSEDRPTEIITTFRPLRLIISQDSSWYEFTISAYNGNQWTKHCSGEVKAESAKSWFDGVRSEGLDLGHGFINVDGITVCATEAQGIVSANKHLDSDYHIHTAVLNSVIQLLSVSSSNSLIRKHKNFLPGFCKELFISRATEDFVMNVAIWAMGNGSTSSRVGKAQAESKEP